MRLQRVDRHFLSPCVRQAHLEKGDSVKKEGRLSPSTTNLTSENGAIRELSFLQCQRSILLAAEIGASYVVIHPGFQNAPVFSKKTAQQRAADALDRLNRFARPRGVKLAVENVGYQGTAIFTMNEYSSFLDPMDDNVGYLIDTGHAFIDHWDIPRLIRTVQHRLLVLHLHDNSGSFDQHLAIGAGSIPWEPIWVSAGETTCLPRTLGRIACAGPAVRFLQPVHLDQRTALPCRADGLVEEDDLADDALAAGKIDEPGAAALPE
jgi:hypothetical protein